MSDTMNLAGLVARLRLRRRIREGGRALERGVFFAAVGWGVAHLLTWGWLGSGRPLPEPVAVSGSGALIPVPFILLALIPALAVLALGLRRALTPPTEAALLLRVEEVHPELDHLLSTGWSATGSDEVRRALRERAEEVARQVDPATVIPLTPSPWGLRGGGAVLALLLLLILLPLPDYPAPPVHAAADSAAMDHGGEVSGGEAPPPPTLDALTLTVTPPRYTGAEPWTGRLEGEVALLAGSRVELRGPILPEGASIRAGRVRMGVEVPDPLEGEMGSGSPAFPSWSAAWTVNGTDRGVSLEWLEDGEPRLHRVVPFTLLPDPPPEVELVAPDRDLVLAAGSGEVELRARARDSFGIADFHLTWVHTRGSGESFDFREGVIPWEATRGGPDEVEGRLTLRLDELGLGPGDVVHLRAVARDGNDVTGPGEGVSRTRQLRVIREGEEMEVTALTGFPLEAERNPVLSQRMILLMTEELVARFPVLTAEERTREAVRIAGEQGRLRAETAEQVYSRATGAMRTGDDHDHGAHSGFPVPIIHPSRGEELTRIGAVTVGGAGEMPVGAGTLPEEGHDHDGDPILSVNRSLLAIYDQMWMAENRLLLTEPAGAIPHQVAALEAIQALREGERLFPRGYVSAPPVDVEGTRGTGSVEDADPAPRSAGLPLGGRGERVAELDRLAFTPDPVLLSRAAVRFLADPDLPGEVASLLARGAELALSGDVDGARALIREARERLGEGERWSAGGVAALPRTPAATPRLTPGTPRVSEESGVSENPSSRVNPFVFATLRYESGNWDSAPLVPTNLIHSLARYTDLPVEPEGVIVELGSPELFRYPFVYLTGHLPVRFSEVEAENLRRYVEGGGFLFMDDHNHDVDGAFHRTATAELARIFGGDALQPLPNDHELYRSFFLFEDGPPVTSHELSGWGDGLIHPELFAIQVNGRIAVLYSNKDYSSEWNYHAVNKRFLAVDNTRIGVNFVLYALTR